MDSQQLTPHPGFAKSAEWWWGLLRRLFDFPDVADFPTLTVLPSEDERQRLNRFLRQTQLLVQSEGLNAPSGVRTRWSRDDGWSVESNFPSYEALTGLTGHFRQLYDHGEPGSFYSAMEILRRLSADGSDHERARLEALREWSRAVGRLRSKGAEQLANEAIGGPLAAEEVKPTPQEVMKTFMYADHVHWDREKAAQLEEWRAHPVLAAHFQYEFHQAVAPLAYLFLLFADFVSDVLRRAEQRAV